MSQEPAPDWTDLTPEVNQQVRSAVHQLAGAADRARHAVGRRIEVGDTEFVALAFLRRTGPLPPKEIGNQLHLTTSSITAVLDRLEQRGLATRTPNPSDRRSLLIEITDAGEETLLLAARSTAQPLQAHLNGLIARGDLTPSDLLVAVRVMGQLSTALLEVATQVDERS